jgi:hypothetical protein
MYSVKFEPIEAQWTRVPNLEELMAEQVARETGLEVVKGYKAV